MNISLPSVSKNAPVIQHTLNNASYSRTKLETILKDTAYADYEFIANVQMGYYTFTYYSKKLRLAIEIDSYIDEHAEVTNRDAPKKLLIGALGIHVLRLTDYQILTDCDEVSRMIKKHIIMNAA